MKLSSGEELRSAVEHANWPLDADVVLLATDGTLSREDLYQVYYSTSYLLYPRRVWLNARPDSDGPTDQSGLDSSGRSRYVVLIGAPNAFRHARYHRISDRIALVELP